MAITIITVGNKHESWISEGLSRYQKRLKKPFLVEWVLLPHSAHNGPTARDKESSAILSRLDPSDYVILLDERGSSPNSTEISTIIGRQLDQSKHIVIIIGGAYGVNAALTDRANYVWSLSKLIFPHQLVRLILIEQLYRSQEIYFGNPYHHD